MATTSRTLDITVVDSRMNETTYKLNGGADSGIGLSSIRSVYAPMISGGYLYSSRGYPITGVVQAYDTTIVTTKTELE